MELLEGKANMGKRPEGRGQGNVGEFPPLAGFSREAPGVT